MAIKQGASPAATSLKQDGLFGIYRMQGTRWKDRYPLVFVDLYSGSGENVVDGQSIIGSPLSLLSGLAAAIRSSNTVPKYSDWLIVFNDITTGRATDILPENVMRWQEENGLPVNSSVLSVTNKNGWTFNVPIRYMCSPSSDVVEDIQAILGRKNQAHFTLLIDPNGPKDAPWDALREIWEKHKNKVDLLFHISATTLKRCAKAKESTGMNFAPMPDHVKGLIDAFYGCGGWVRGPVGADQWTILLISSRPPKNGWGNSFHLIQSIEGDEVIKRLSLTKSELSK
jgi:hypothetical protein